jgi:exodeoxyribonuclease VII small subunit
MPSAARASAPKPASFETAMQELEQLLARLEAGALPLEQLHTQYQRGAELLKYCRERLEAVEEQIKVLDQGSLKTWTAD